MLHALLFRKEGERVAGLAQPYGLQEEPELGGLDVSSEKGTPPPLHITHPPAILL